MKNSDKVDFSAKYKKGAMMIKPHALPTLHHVAEGAKVESVEIMEAGRMVSGLEYQIIRVLFQRPKG